MDHSPHSIQSMDSTVYIIKNQWHSSYDQKKILEETLKMRLGNHVTVPCFVHRMITSADKGVLDTFVFTLYPEIQTDIPLPHRTVRVEFHYISCNVNDNVGSAHNLTE